MQASSRFCKTGARILPNLRSPLNFPLQIPRPIAPLGRFRPSEACMICTAVSFRRQEHTSPSSAELCDNHRERSVPKRTMIFQPTLILSSAWSAIGQPAAAPDRIRHQMQAHSGLEPCSYCFACGSVHLICVIRDFTFSSVILTEGLQVGSASFCSGQRRTNEGGNNQSRVMEGKKDSQVRLYMLLATASPSFLQPLGAKHITPLVPR